MDCPDCKPDRRQFLKAAALAPLAYTASAAPAKNTPTQNSETLVTTFAKTLTDEQKKAMWMPFDHELRSKVDNNWFITGARVGGKLFNPDQQAMIREIFQGLYNPQFFDKVLLQLDEDAKGLGNYA